MVMDSTDYYHGIIYHANTVEFQCTYPTSLRAFAFPLFFASSFSVKLNSHRNLESLSIIRRSIDQSFFKKRFFGQRYLRFQDSSSRSLSLKIIPQLSFSNFKFFQRREGIEVEFDRRKCSPTRPLSPSSTGHKGRDTGGLSTWSLTFPWREEGEGDSEERRSGCPRGF